MLGWLYAGREPTEFCPGKVKGKFVLGDEEQGKERAKESTLMF